MDNPLFTRQDFKKLIPPLLIEQLLAVLVGMADVVMISGVGEAAVSGVSLVDMFNVLLINVFAALATGGAVITSQLLGAKQRDRACNSAAQLLMIAALVGVTIGGGVIILRTPMLRLFFGSIEADVMSACLTYLTIGALSYPFLAVYNASAALFRSMGNARVSMITSVGMNIVNIIGNAICVYGFGMGVEGVALPTLLARAGAAAVMLWLIRNPELEVHLPSVKFRFNKEIIKNILRVGVPSAIENSFFQLGRVLVVSMIAGFGTVQIAANAVANNFDGLGIIPAQAMNLALITVVGKCVGAKDYKQATYYIKKLMGFTYLLSGLTNAVILLTLPYTLKMYQLSAETVALATILIFIHDGCAIFIWPLAFTLPNVLRAAGDVRYTMTISIISMWTFRILGSYILAVTFGMGAIGVWLAMIVDWVCRSLCFTVRYLRGKWKTKRLI